MMLVATDDPDQPIVVPLEMTKLSGNLSDMLEDFSGATDITIPVLLTKVVVLEIKTFLENEVKQKRPPNEEVGKGREKVIIVPLTEWDRTYLNRLYSADEKHELFSKVFQGANYLIIRPLIDLCAQFLANLAKGLKTEQMRELWKIESDFAEGEEEKIRKENEWN